LSKTLNKKAQLLLGSYNRVWRKSSQSIKEMVSVDVMTFDIADQKYAI